LFIKKDVLHQPCAALLDNGLRLNKFTCGVAILEAPFFFIAYSISAFSGNHTNGFEDIYGLFIVIAACVYMYIALYVLYIMLSKKTSRVIALISIVAIYGGTNLFYYTVVESGMSHAFSFFCFAMFVYFTDKYYERKNLKSIVAIGFFLGLATLIRPTNILLIILFLFYETYKIGEMKERIFFHIKHYCNFIILLIIGLIVFSPQLIYWYELTGKYIFYSYRNETFSNWNAPKILEVLAGHKSGWLLYSPVMLFSLIGLAIALKNKMFSAPAISLILIIIIYVCASWWAYTFGCAFGYRSFSEYSAVLIFPMALCFDKGFKNNNIFFKIVLVIPLLVFIYYNLKITQLYYQSGGCWDGPNWFWTNYVEKLQQVF
jgi:hypothetical protein